LDLIIGREGWSQVCKVAGSTIKLVNMVVRENCCLDKYTSKVFLLILCKCFACFSVLDDNFLVCDMWSNAGAGILLVELWLSFLK